jgi:dynein heavy chain
VYRALQASLTSLRQQGSRDQGHQVVHTHALNPKALNMGELYGQYNLATDEWADGLASSLIRAAVGDTSADHHWVVFDGPVDAVWVENMNTGGPKTAAILRDCLTEWLAYCVCAPMYGSRLHMLLM